MSALIHVPPETTAEQVVALLDESAAVVVDAAITEHKVEKLKNEISPYLDEVHRGVNNFSGTATRRVGALIARSPTCRELALNPLVNDVAESLLGRHADGYQLHFSQAVSIEPGESTQPFHRDRGVWGGHVPRSIETQLGTVWALDEFTAANGATRIVPGSQNWEKTRLPIDGEAVAAEMDPGSVLLYTGTVLHGGGANQTASSRLAVLLHYTLSWLRQEENQYLSCPPDVASDLGAELRELIGYSRGGPVLGFYSDPYDSSMNSELADPAAMFS